ncbi:VRR-NUC domain-containing protein [Brachymonas sp. G13]|uniref:VRR-NUC domain-containing protein n=1 Tax=Brachymonas TaxID=28219 RepID=UPI002E7777C1|nr:VRR-NUC domain-containing protein [Brachymonas sp. J145]MEE1654484.1 VRR-NUC domain-containing protein [Brachymonas sp. J145]
MKLPEWWLCMWGCEMVRTDAKHLSAPKAEKVQMSATPYRVAPISTCPAPDTDLLGDEIQKPRTNSRPEAAALLEVLKALSAHPAVAWAERMNSGAAKVQGRFIRFGWAGCPDVLGQMRDGRLLGVEVKAPTGRLRPEQALFLERIRAAGGVAFVARNCRDVLRELQAWGEQ